MPSPRASYRPFLRGAASTLRASVEVLARNAAGRLSSDEVDQLFARWRHRVLDAAQVQLEVRGREHVKAGQAYVVMFNHRSHVDIPVLLEAFPQRLRGVSKAELGRVPVWGPAMRALGFVFIDRGSRQRAIQQLEAAKDLLRQGTSVFVAPEGTRSRDGTLLPFKKGGFHLARDLQVPIVPVWIEGTAAIMRPKSFAILPGQHVTATLGAPIASDIEVGPLAERVRAAMVAMAGAGPQGAGPLGAG